MVKRAREADALALPAGKTNTTLPHDRIKAVTQFRFNKIEDLCNCAGFAQSRRVDLVIRQAKRDVARDRIVYEKDVLWHVTDGSLPGGHEPRSKRLTID